jgi:hypothetical protein
MNGEKVYSIENLASEKDFSTMMNLKKTNWNITLAHNFSSSFTSRCYLWTYCTF